MSLEVDQQGAIEEALLLGADRQLAGESVGVDANQFYRWLNTDSSFKERVKLAESRGKEHAERTARMRSVVERHDAALGILQERQKRYREAQAQNARGVQTSLFK